MFITESELAAKRVRDAATSAPEAILKDLIDGHDIRHMEEGERYYHNEAAIKKRQIYVTDEAGQKIVDKEAINNRVAHNWHKLLVDQKVSYLLGKPVTLSGSEEHEKLIEELNNWLSDRWHDRLQEIGKKSSNKGVEYLHPYINEDGEFRFVIIPAEQGIPIYDTDYQEEVVQFIRHYPVWVDGKERLRAEWWTKDDVTYYLEQENGTFELETAIDGRSNPDGHYKVNGSPVGWGKVPFVEFRNNEEKYPDLKYYKEIIDIYDLIVSDLANDLSGLQRFIYVLRGYGGQDLDEFLTNLRRYRAINVDERGGVDLAQADIPVEAIESFLDREEENIFLFGQGLNVKTDRFGQSPSGVALRFLYHLLDLKANTMARKFSFAIKEFLWFLIEYLRLKGKVSVSDDALGDIEVVFNKTMITNDLELVDIALKSRDLLSDRTIRSHHPWTVDEQKEAQRLEEEREQSDYVNLDEEPDEELDDE